jgi:lysophospholipase L1-like esterase
MMRFFRILAVGLKWIILAAISLEIFCFLVITATNYLVFGQPWEGSLVNYDAYAIFLNVEGVQPTLNNPPETGSPAAGKSPRRLWLLGGSTMRGGWVKAGETIPSYLAEIINRPGSPDKVIVTNFGENSFNSLLETKYLQKLLIDAAEPPDLIIFYDGANDCSYFDLYRTPQAHYGYRRLQGLVESYRRSRFSLFKPLYSALYSSFTLEVFDRSQQTMVPVYPNNLVLREFAAETGKRYEHVRRLAGAYGAKFLLVWQPFLWVETGKVDPKVREQERSLDVMGARFLRVRENFSTTCDLLENLLKDKPYFVDFRNALCSRTTPVYEIDGVHLKPPGNKMVATRLAEMLKDRGWLENGAEKPVTTGTSGSDRYYQVAVK